MFVVTLTYLKSIEEIEARTAEHRAWLDQHVQSGLVRCDIVEFAPGKYHPALAEFL